jgi:aerobic carbon-monoxide dehydrogenase medium subunit
MIPPPFEYERASSVDEAVSLLVAGGEDAKLLAGGHSLLPLMKLRLARPSLLISSARSRTSRTCATRGRRSP